MTEDETPSRTMTSLTAGSALAAIVPRNLDDVARIAKMAVIAGLPLGIQKKKGARADGEDGAASDDAETRQIAVATIIIMQGLEVGLSPMQALTSIALINGRPLIWGDAVPALLWRAGFKIEETMRGEGDDRVAICRITRPDGSKVERTFSVAAARRAGLWDVREKIQRWGKNFQTGKSEKYEVDNDSPWFRFPERMLAMRARGFAVKDGASDVTRGLYIREEYQDLEATDVTSGPDSADLVITATEVQAAPAEVRHEPAVDLEATTAKTAEAAPAKARKRPPMPDME